jgi:hypothetical protein
MAQQRCADNVTGSFKLLPERGLTVWGRLLKHVGLRAETIHFLHLGKNAGTEIARYIDALNTERGPVRIKKHGHNTFLRHLPATDRYFFSVRDPISRFQSGFYSRKRKGQPRIYSEWSAYERVAFDTFEHANDLAEALFRSDELGAAAFGAMKSIRHTAQNQVDWFYGCGNLFKVRPPVAVIRHGHFAADVMTLQRKLGVERPVLLPSDRVASHQNDYREIPELSELAARNLRTWYAQDFEFYRQCCQWAALHN